MLLYVITKIILCYIIAGGAACCLQIIYRINLHCGNNLIKATMAGLKTQADMNAEPVK